MANRQAIVGKRVTPMPSEQVIPDSYPVCHGYYYIIDGVIVRSDISGTARELKRRYGNEAAEIRRCEFVQRGLKSAW